MDSVLSYLLPAGLLAVALCSCECYLVREGQPEAVVVVPDKASIEVSHAAAELVEYVHRISGAKLKTVKTLPDGPAVVLHIDPKRNPPPKGAMQWPGSRGYRLRVDGNKLYIIGSDDLSVLHGVYGLLERHAGVRWLWPGKLGEIVPKQKTLQIGPLDETSVPDFPVRWVGTNEWALHHGANAMVRVGKEPVGVNWKWHFHTFCTLIPAEKYYDKHPEWWPLVKGKRKKPAKKHSHSTQLCTTNPDMIKEMTRNLIAVLDEDPEIQIIALSPNDGGGFCECERCTALDEPGRGWFAKYSKRLAALNNAVAREVAKKHPNVLIKVGAYAMYLRRPLDEKLAPTKNQLVQLCHIYCCHNHPLCGDHCVKGKTYEPKDNFMPNRTFRKMIHDWKKVTDHLFIYEYYTLGGPTRAKLPWPLVHCIRKDMPYYHKIGAEGFYTQLGDKTFYRYGMNYYIAAKLAWDTSLDVDELMADYCTHAFGPAAEPMLAYFNRMEQAMVDADICISYGLGNAHRFGPKVFTDAVLKESAGHLKRALAAAPKGDHRRRVEFFKKGFDEAAEAIKEMKTKEKK